MKRTVFHLALGSVVVTTALGAGVATRLGPIKCKSGAPTLKTTVTTNCPSSPTARISTKYRDGVCLIVGTYSFTGPDGRPLRYVSPDLNGLPAFEGDLNVSFRGTGDVYQLEFTYTGFVVENGKILTTRHTAEPWSGDPEARRIMGCGGKPRLEALTAYFPASKKPFALTVDTLSTESDLALCTFNPEGKSFPILPVETSLPGNQSGLAVVSVGFPTGVDGLIAQNQPPKAHFENSDSVEDQASWLAAAGRLVPLVGQGNLQVYADGKWTTQGVPASESIAGSPLFGPDGVVIGVFSVQASTEPDGKEASGLNPAVPLQKVQAFLDGKSTKTVVTETTKKR